eukprot:4556756-Prymnesium_polylepis.1
MVDKERRSNRARIRFSRLLCSHTVSLAPFAQRRRVRTSGWNLVLSHSDQRPHRRVTSSTTQAMRTSPFPA